MRKAMSFALVVVIVAGASAFALTREKTPTYVITADVEQAPNLFEDGRVMVRGVEVGTIVSVTPRPEGVKVTLEIAEGVDVPADARLAVVPITVIADRYVQLYPAYRGGPKLADGDHLGLDRTHIPAELDEVLGQLKALLDALAPAGPKGKGPLTRLVTSLDQALRGRSDELAGTIEGSATVLENLADSDDDITALIRNLDSFFAALANRSSEIGVLNERFELVAEALASDQEHLEGTIENLTLLSEQGAGLVSESGDDLGVSFRRLKRVVDTILSHRESLTKGISWGNVIAQGFGETDASGRGLWAYSGRQAAPGTPGAQYNYRLDTRDTIACERLEFLVASLLAVNPDATVEILANVALTYIPDVYDDDLRFLIEILMGLCAKQEQPDVAAAEERRVIRAAMQRVGRERFLHLVGRWVAEGLTGEKR